MIDEAKAKFLPAPGQNTAEWLAFLHFTDAILTVRGVKCPLVVEIGVHTACQKAFWETFFDARYIGIDISDKYCKPDILGDSASPEVLAELLRRISPRPIDVLFIDADHAYESVKSDYTLYAPLTRHIVAFHDLFCLSTVYRVWDEARIAEYREPKGTLFVTFGSGPLHEYEEGNSYYQMGIGAIVKSPLRKINIHETSG